MSEGVGGQPVIPSEKMSTASPSLSSVHLPFCCRLLLSVQSLPEDLGTGGGEGLVTTGHSVSVCRTERHREDGEVCRRRRNYINICKPLGLPTPPVQLFWAVKKRGDERRRVQETVGWHIWGYFIKRELGSELAI